MGRSCGICGGSIASVKEYTKKGKNVISHVTGVYCVVCGNLLYGRVLPEAKK